MLIKLRITAVVLVLASSGCSNRPTNVAPDANGVDRLPCVGSIGSAVPGLVESDNAPLLGQAQRPSGGGGVCLAKSFSVTQPVRRYRVIDSTQPFSKLGGWWSFTRPIGTRDDYRAANAIRKQ